MTTGAFDEKLTSDLRSQLTALLGQEPYLSPKDAMTKITKEMLKNNPFVPPEGDKCPINRLPDELLAQIFEVGMDMEVDAKRFGEDDDDNDDDDGEYELDDDDDDEAESADDEGGQGGSEIFVDMTGEGAGGDDEWSDVDDEDNPGTKKALKDWGDEMAESDEEDDGDEESALPFQVLVSHVCRRWRAVSLNTPPLWTHLEFEKGTPLDKHSAYIDRAKTAPIDILIDCTFEDAFEDDPELQATNNAERDKELVECLKNSLDHLDPSLPDLFGDPNWRLRHGLVGPLPQREPLDDHYYTITEFSQILDLIIPHVSHWRALAVSVSDYRWVYLLLARLHQCGPAECLEIFELYHYDSDDEGKSQPPRQLRTKFTPFHGEAPRLQDCAFWGVHLDWDASFGMFKGLQDLELAYHTDEVRPSFKTFADVLDSSPEIRTLTLCLSGPHGTEDDWREANASPVQVASLQNLVLRYHEPQYACSLLRFLDTPNVHSLVLDFDGQDYSDFAKDLCKAAHGRSKSLLAGLQNLKISGLPCGRALVGKMLEQLINLKSFNLNCSGEEEVFFDVLHKASGIARAGNADVSLSSRRVYCPALETVTTSGITGKQMKEFVEARTAAGAPVKRVFMSENDEVDILSERWLKDHVKEFEYFESSDSEEEVFVDVDGDEL